MFGRRPPNADVNGRTRPRTQPTGETRTNVPETIAAKPIEPAATAGIDDVSHALAMQKGAPSRSSAEGNRDEILAEVLERIDASTAVRLSREDLQSQLGGLVAEILLERRIVLGQREQQDLTRQLVDEMVGFGPLEPLLNDESVTDIMVNGPSKVYVERGGKLVLTDVTFRSNAHVMNVAQRIVSRVGRRIDESVPLVDARLPDGSRVNIIAPPLALDGTSISIRKFSQKKITLDVMARQKNLSNAMATTLKIAAASRLNILVSGGTGSGKTTLLNALSRMIDIGERIVTIEDAAELQLQQPHVVRLETRPMNIEGRGEITMRDLVKNALRMRPDRIILGEIRGEEAIDMLQAMNTGHDGSLSTVHANSSREALIRIENMISLGGHSMSERGLRTQIANAIDMIVQIERMRDGIRRITQISEVLGLEGDVILMQDLFTFDYGGALHEGRLVGDFRYTGLRPAFLKKAGYFGYDRVLLAALNENTQ
jgi:pilus assembly protein CpaF